MPIINLVYEAPEVVTTAGIYHNATLGLISLSSDGQTWITIADKNLGATTVWNSGDALSEANCGKYYQRGNNYGFSFTGSVTTSSTQVDASNYGPGNYYSSITFITAGDADWSSNNNTNLWGGETNTVEAMKGPCPEGFHICREWGPIKQMFEQWSLNNGNSPMIYLKMPPAGCINGNGVINDKNTTGLYRCTRAFANAMYTRFVKDGSRGTGGYYKSYGFSIRPFKNEAVQPDTSRTKLY